MDRRVIFLVVLLNVIYVWSSPPRGIHIRDKPEFFCGNKLSDALTLVCKGNYNSPKPKKSQNDVWTYDDYGFLNDDEDNQVDFPFYAKQASISFSPIRYRRGGALGGIVEECCMNPCTYNTLRLYCA